MNAPTAFVEKLEHEFGGRLRIRWSCEEDEWHIEQQMGRGTFEVPPDVLRYSDMWVRARDGYSFVMAIKPKDWMYCPECHAALMVPVLETAEIKCPRCAKGGREAHYYAAFYPLTDTLLTFLHQIDPLRTNIAQTQCDAADEANAQLATSVERSTLNSIESMTKDHWRQLAGIQGVGYTRPAL
jgi:hypothetical protein